jgi:hypothetical protein
MKNGGAHRTPPFFFTMPRFAKRCLLQRMNGQRTLKRTLSSPPTYQTP